MGLLCFFILFLFTSSIRFVSTDTDTDTSSFFLLQICENEYNYTQNSVYSRNLNYLLTNLSSEASPVYFYNTTRGENVDKVYGFKFCPAYISSQDCNSCIQSAAALITQKCPNQKGAVIYYLECVLRYANYSFFSIVDYGFGIYWTTTIQVYNTDQFNRSLTIEIDRLITKAAFGSSEPRFETGEVSVTDGQILYCFVQCSPDLNKTDCNACLKDQLLYLQTKCFGDEYALSYASNCQVRYSIAPFYDTNISPSPLPSPSPPDHSNIEARAGKRRWVYITVVSIVSLGILLILVGIYLIRRKVVATRTETENDEIVPAMDSLQYNYGTIRVATNNFNIANKLGEGGFGPVYKGVLVNGQEIAVKKLSGSSKQGLEEFKNEVLLLARLRHKHLVTLLGFCLGGKEKLLIYEFMPNKSLDYFIFDPIKCEELDWERRYGIIQGIARGLLYLHEDSQDRIIHRDLKPSNILLDTAMEPKISDFGTAKLVLLDQSHHKASKIMGTLGYMSPEYTKNGIYSVKSDVYSFGVILLEILSGRKIFCFLDKATGDNLLSYAWRNWKKNTALDIVDPVILRSAPKNEVIKCIHIALLCVQENATKRPTMDLVVNVLSDSSTILPLPSQPAFFVRKEMENLNKFCNELPVVISEQLSVNEVTITKLDPR